MGKWQKYIISSPRGGEKTPRLGRPPSSQADHMMWPPLTPKLINFTLEILTPDCLLEGLQKHSKPGLVTRKQRYRWEQRQTSQTSKKRTVAFLKLHLPVSRKQLRDQGWWWWRRLWFHSLHSCTQYIKSHPIHQSKHIKGAILTWSTSPLYQPRSAANAP